MAVLTHLIDPAYEPLQHPEEHQLPLVDGQLLRPQPAAQVAHRTAVRHARVHAEQVAHLGQLSSCNTTSVKLF